MRSAVVTIAAGRPDHLARQCAGIRASLSRPDIRVVVALDEGEQAEIAALCPSARVIASPADAGDGRFQLAAARNAGAEYALEREIDLLVFLDVDCIPAPELVGRYAEAAKETGPALLCGSVAYLPPAPPDGFDPARLDDLGRAHPARPLPDDDEVLRDGDHRLFWSLSFAVTAETWRRVGGFCEEYSGYGGEDTDFGQLARQAGVELCWVGGARAFHQHHATGSQALAHGPDILRNAAVFRRRWGWWPMRGWLDELAAAGLASYDAVGDSWGPARR
jgi:GT2 family glycosyltransferase